MNVLYFAQAAAAAGCREETWPTPSCLSLDAFWDEAIRRHPALAPFRAHARVACGFEYLAPEQTIDPARDVAILPPVSGG